jgi:hypothetical protein
MAFWNPTQGRRNELDNERPNFSSELIDRRYEALPEKYGTFEQRRELNVRYSLHETRKRAPGLQVRFYELEPAQHGDVTADHHMTGAQGILQRG